MRITLKTKIWFTVLTIVLMFSFFSLYYFPLQQEKYLLNNYNTEVQNLANTISLGVEIALTEENFEGVKTAMSFVKDDHRLQFVNLLLTDTLWSDDHREFLLKDSVLQTFPERLAGEQLMYPENTIIKKRATFDTEMMSGAIELGVNTDDINIGKRQIRITSMQVSSVFLAIGIAIGFWLSRSISIPVLALRDAANKVGEGDLTQRVINNSGDEIGELATAFNKMVVDLARAREELRTAEHQPGFDEQCLTNHCRRS
jgi:methyl-accepting chemotaxis protein